MIHPNGQGAHAGNLQHPAVQQDSRTTSHRDGQSKCFLVERGAAERQLWEWA